MPRRDKNAPSHPNRPFDYTNWSRIPEFKITAEAVLQFMDLIDHGSIQGLEDDDHLQYVHLSNPRIITASHRIQGKWFFESNQDLGGYRIENLGTPVYGSDAATKAYVDDIASTKTTYSDLWDNMIVTGVGLSIPSHGVVRVDHGVAYVGGRRVFVNGLDIVAAEHPNVTVTGVYVVYLDGYVKEGEALVAYPKVDHVANRPANRRENVIGLFSYVEGTGAVSNLTTGPALNAIPAPEGGHYRDPHTAKLYAYINEDLTERQVMYLADGSAFWPAKAGLDLGRDEEWGHRWNAIYGRTLHLLANAYVRGEVVEGGVALADKYAAIDHNHDGDYLPITGGTLQGSLTINGDLLADTLADRSGYDLAHVEASEDPPGQVDAPQGTLWAYIGTPGSGGGVSQIQIEDADTPATAVSLISFQGNVLSVSGGIATLDLDSRYTQFGHNHDERYLKLTGGTLTGKLVAAEFEDTSGYDLAHVQVDESGPGSAEAPDGTFWAYVGTPGSGGGVSQIQFEDDDTPAGAASLLKFQGSVLSISGGIATLDLDSRYSQHGHRHAWGDLDNIPVYASRWPTPAEVGAAPEVHHHDERYLKLTGGTLTGKLIAPEFEDTSGYALAHIEAAENAPGQANAPDGTLWAYVGAPGSGGAGQIQFEDDNTPAAAASLLKFQGDVLSVSGGIATLNLDGRYLQLSGGTISGTLTVDGGVGVGTRGTFIIRQKGNTADDGLAITSEAPSSFRMFVDAGNLVHFTRSDQSDSAIRIDASRRVGIRTNPTSGYNLTVAGGLNVSSGTLAVAGNAVWHAGNFNPATKADVGHLHDDRYLKLTGGTLSGPLTATSFSDTSGFDLAHVRVDEDAPGMTNAPDGTFWAYVGSPGSGGGVGQIQFEDDNTAPSTASLLKFQGDVLSISGGVATLNLDGRYALVGHNHDGVYAPISHNHDDRYALVNHNHDGVYASASQNQTISGLWTFRRGANFPSLIVARDGFQTWGIGPSTSGGVQRFTIRNENTGAAWGFYVTGRIDGPGDGSVTIGGSLTVNGDLYGPDYSYARWHTIPPGVQGGLYHAGHDVHIYADTPYYWNIRSIQGLRFFEGSTVRGYLYHDASYIGLIPQDGAWGIRVGNGGTILDRNGHTVASVIVSGSSPSGSARNGTLWCIV